jgi:formamidopyrimidine-DNA glycosylase
MTGSFLVKSSDDPRHPMTRNYFSMDDERELLFVDPRKLGMLWLVEDESELTSMLGPEPLEPEFTANLLGQILFKKMVPVKAILCDQKLVAGIGNIYADEVLFTSNIHPLTPGKEISENKVSVLRESIVSSLSKAVDTLDRLVQQGRGLTESYEGSMTLRVPRKAGNPCSSCGTDIQRVQIRGRSTYFCGMCQPRMN